jgi:hypothetical protein
VFLLQTSLVAERECQMAEPKLNVHSLAFSAFAVGVRLVNQLIHLVKLIAFVVKFASLGGHRKRHQEPSCSQAGRLRFSRLGKEVTMQRCGKEDDARRLSGQICVPILKYYSVGIRLL